MTIKNKPDHIAEAKQGDSETPELHSKSKGFKSVTSTSSNADLNFGILERPSMWPLRPYDICLVAPTEKVAKLWRKLYPGFEVLTQRKYRGHDLPVDCIHKEAI